MKREIVGWFNKVTGRTGSQVKAFSSDEEYRKWRRQQMRRHPDRAYGIVARTGGSDG